MNNSNINIGIKVDTTELQKLQQQLKELRQQRGANNGTSTSFKEEANILTQIHSLQNSLMKQQQTYAQLINKSAREMQLLQQQTLKAGGANRYFNTMGVNSEFKQLNNSAATFNKQLDKSVEKFGYLGSFAQKFRSHFNWIATGGVIAGLAGIPFAVQNITKETEVLGLKIKQNLELVEKYHKNHQLLEADVKHLSEVASVYAVGYGADVKDVMEMMQILSRRFKSAEELTYYTNLALVMHKLDFVAPKQAAENLESVILSMGLNFMQAKDFIDQFSVAVHTARITGSDLLLALQRSGSTFKNMNFNTAESIAMISALSTVVAKSGQNIGVSLNSILTNIDFKKGADALKAYGIEVYNTNGEMRKGVEVWREVAQTFNGLNDEKANQFALAMSGGKFRINDLKAIVSTWHEFEEILKEINEKASPELTAALLKTGLESYETKLLRLNASMQVFGKTLGDELMPLLKGLVDGLGQGVHWMNQNKESVTQLISAIAKITLAIAAWRLKNLLLKDSLMGAAIGIAGIYSKQGQYVTAMRVMGEATWGFARTATVAIGTVAARFAAVFAMMEMANQAIEMINDPEMADLRTKINNAQGMAREMEKKGNYILNERPWDKDSLRLFNENAEGQKFHEDNAKNLIEWQGHRLAERAKANPDPYMAQVNKQMEKAYRDMFNLGQKEPPTYPDVPGADLGSKSKGGNAGSSSVEPSDPAVKLAKDGYKIAQDEMFHLSKLAADQYAVSLDQLSTKEDIYGKTVQVTIQGYNLKQKRITDLAAEERKYANEASYLESILDDQLATNEELQKSLGATEKKWSDMSKEERSKYKFTRRELLEQHDLTKTVVKLMNDYKEKASETHKEIVKITDELLKQRFSGVLNEDDIRKRKLSTIDNEVETDKANIGYNKPMQEFQEREMEYQAELKRLQIYRDYQEKLVDDIKAMKEAEIARAEAALVTAQAMADGEAKTKALAEATLYLEAARRGDTQAILQLTQAQEENNKNIAVSVQKQQQLKDKFFEIRKAWANNLADMVVEGKSISDVFKNLWQELAREAILNIFKVNQYQSLLAQSAGKKSGSIGPRMENGRFNSSGKGKAAFADGGIVNRPTLGLIGEAGEEANINLSKLSSGDKRQESLLSYANSKLQSQPKQEYVTALKNPELAKAITTTNIQVQQSREHILEMQKTNKLMMQQNQMLLHMMQNQGGSGSPVIINGTSDQQIMDAINRNPRAMQGINGRHKSNGFR